MIEGFPRKQLEDVDGLFLLLFNRQTLLLRTPGRRHLLILQTLANIWKKEKIILKGQEINV